MGFKINQFGCPICGGKLAKAQVIFADKGGVKHLKTPYHYCMKCKKMLKIKLQVEDEVD